MFMESQGPAWASSADKLVNEAAKRVYTLTRITAHKSIYEYVQGGDSIKDRIFLDVKSTWQRYNPNVKIDYQMLQTGQEWTVPWAFGTAHVSWTKHEVGLNKDTMTAKFRAQRYKAVMHQKYQNLYTDICNNIEEEMWAVPSSTLMEATTLPAGGVRRPASIPMIVNEFASSLHSGDGTGAFTTVQQINPTTAGNEKWVPQGETYGASFDTAANAAKIFAPMSKLARKMRFDKLPKGPQYSDPTSRPHVWMCSSQGLANYEFALQSNQDQFRGIGKMSGQDPDYNAPTFRGIPFEYIESLDTAAIYPTGASNALSTELDTSNTPGTAGLDGNTIGFAGPRYYLMNFEYWNYVVHSEYYMDMGTPFKLEQAGQPFSYAQVVDCWNNLLVRSRRRGAGLLFPSADVTSA